MKTKYIRERAHDCGPRYKEIDIYPRFVGQTASAEQREQTRALERHESTLAQKNLNDKNARRHLLQLIPLNFTPGTGLHVTATYADEYLPGTEAEALADRANYLRRIKRACQNKGLKNPKFIAVTEYQEADPKQGRKAVRFHHHIILDCELGRDEIEALWAIGQGKARRRLGRVNADRLQFDKGNCEALVEYLLKYPKRRRRWTQSLGLKQPRHRAPNDEKYTNRQVEDICKSGAIFDPSFWAKKYKGWSVAEARPVYNDLVGWSIYLRLYKEPPPARKAAEKADPYKMSVGELAEWVEKRRAELKAQKGKGVKK